MSFVSTSSIWFRISETNEYTVKNANTGPGLPNEFTRIGNKIEINPDVKKLAIVGIEMNIGSTISATYRNTIGPKEIPNPGKYKAIPKRTRTFAVSPVYKLNPNVMIMR